MKHVITDKMTERLRCLWREYVNEQTKFAKQQREHQERVYILAQAIADEQVLIRTGFYKENRDE